MRRIAQRNPATLVVLQAWVMRDKRSRTLVVSFRGTHERQVKTLTNLAFVPVPPVLSSTITQARDICGGVRLLILSHTSSRSCCRHVLSLSAWRCRREDGADVHHACASGRRACARDQGGRGGLQPEAVSAAGCEGRDDHCGEGALFSQHACNSVKLRHDSLQRIAAHLMGLHAGLSAASARLDRHTRRRGRPSGSRSGWRASIWAAHRRLPP